MAGRSGGFHGSSPILLLKNFNQDRGLALFKAIYDNSPGPTRSASGHVQAAAPVHRAANHVLDIATAAVRRHGNENDVRLKEHLRPTSHPHPNPNPNLSPTPCPNPNPNSNLQYNQVRALRHRTPYNMTLSRAYKAGKNELPHQVDALGNWVVLLFSFGLTVDFYVGHKTVCIESGDALIFKAARRTALCTASRVPFARTRPTAGRSARSRRHGRD